MFTKEMVTVQDSPMDILHFTPAGEGPHPALIVCQHIPVAHKGLETDPWQIAVGERLAGMGHAVAMPFVFHWWDREADIQVKRDGFRDDWVVADLKITEERLAVRPEVDENRIGIIGHCWGGRVSWLGACHLPAMKALVTLYGGRIKLPMADGGTPPIALSGQIPCPVLGIFGNDDANP